MHITAWKDGYPIKDWDLGQYGDDQAARHALERLVEYLNQHSLVRRYEISDLGERVIYPEDDIAENGVSQETPTLFDLRTYQLHREH